MAINTKRISCAELDFDTIKTNFKKFLSGQDQFTDYDFEGSSMSVLLDVLAYNTHYRALYDNFTINEKFLDSASKRENVVSRANEMGYTPTSIKAATAYTNFTLSGAVNGPAVLTLQKSTPFSATINGITYTFLTTETHSIAPTNGSYVINNIKLIQGSYLTTRMNVGTNVKYVVPNANVDASTITVKVQDNSQSNVYNTFKQSDSFIGIASTDRVFWIKEVSGGLYELEFGNDTIGKALINGNIVHIEYVVTDGSVANGAKLFRYIGTSLYQGNVTTTTVAQSSGGTEIESIKSIKFNAPRLYSTQNRAVTVEDYRNIVYNLVPEAASVNVWSGSDNVPPVYGKVFICIKPKTVKKFTNIEKVAIKNDVVKSRNVVSVIPEIIDPQYIKVGVNSSIYMNPKTTTKSVGDIKLLVQTAIIGYNVSDLQKFEGILRFSKLTRLIDDADSSIISNVTNLVLYRTIEPKYNVTATYKINLINPIHAEMTEPSITSTGFYIYGSDKLCHLKDDGLGNICLFTMTNGVDQVINSKIGTVNYSKGLIEINNLRITTIVGVDLDLIIKPSSYDIVSILDQLVVIPTELIAINVITDKSLGASGGGSNYEFTSSRS